MKNNGKKFLLFSITVLMLFSIIFVSCPNKSAIAKVSSKVEWTFTQDSEMDENVAGHTYIHYFTIQLENAKTASDLTTESQIEHWTISPQILGATWKITSVDSSRTSFALGISGKPTETLETTPIVVTIPKSALEADSVDEKTGLSVDMRGSTITVNAKTPDPDPDPDTPSEDVVEPTVEISEITFSGQPKETLQGTIKVTSTGATFKKDLSTAEDGVKDWFVDPQVGFTYTLVYPTSSNESQKSVKATSDAKTDSVDIVIKGVFNDESNTDFNYKLQVPATAFNEKVKDSKPTEGSGTIKRDLTYKSATWKLYDSASFKNIATDKTANLNAGLTQYAKAENGSTVITFGDDMLIASGDKTLVQLERGLSRKGYKLVGFAEAKSDGAVDVSDVKYAKTLSDLQGGFLIPENSDAILYAVWSVDDDSTYWKSIDTITITKDEILAANADLKMHDGTTDIADGYTQSFDFIALPGGRIGGTDDAPTYFEWPVDEAFARYADETNTEKVLHEAIFSDFAIADIPVTGGLFAIVKKWADDNGYTFETSGKYNPNAVGGATADAVDRKSVEDPTILNNWGNAVVFANAMTGWYNEKHPNDQLTPVYLLKDGSIFKSADPNGEGYDHESYVAVLTTGQGNWGSANGTKEAKKLDKTGFRLPTYTEWLYAASVSPNSLDSSWNLEGDGAYPFAHSYSYISGYNGDVATDDNVKLYSVYKGLYTEDEGTQVVGKLAQVGNVRYGAKPNLIGLYDMSGNVLEHTEDPENVGSHANCKRYAVGASYLTEKGENLSIEKSSTKAYGFMTKIILNQEKQLNYGIRLVRSLVD